ncbi:hypothetical protein ACUUL3_15900 [Thiovibrio sp. JS02]
MKKVLSTVAALGLVAGLASTASAVEFSMSGDYTVDGVYMSKAEGNGVVLDDAQATNGNADNVSSDAYYKHTFRVLPVMKVNDSITMKAEIRLADENFWGSQDDLAQNGSSMGGDVYVHRLYMDYASPIGKFMIGRVPSGPYGTAYLDMDSRANKIVYNPSFLASGPWSTQFHIIKATDGDQAANTDSEVDSDSYEARLFYKDTNLDSGLRYVFNNNNTVTNVKDQKQTGVVYGKYKMDNYFVNAELVYNFGDKETITGVTKTSADYDSWGGMLEAGGKFDAITASLMYFYAQGKDPNQTATSDMEQFLAAGSGTGTEFYPLYVMTGNQGTGMLNPDINNGYTGAMATAGVHAYVVSADYAASDRLTLHGAIGYAQADEEQIVNQDDEYGWEYNLGAAYKLLDNLTYEAHFGYLDAGDFFKEGVAGQDTENVYLLTHHLTMTF